jgi:hypothetical protein
MENDPVLYDGLFRSEISVAGFVAAIAIKLNCVANAFTVSTAIFAIG